MLSVKKLMPNKNNWFPSLDPVSHEEFKDKIRERGQQEAIIVRPIADITGVDEEYKAKYPEAEYEIISGHKRFRAIQELGIEYIKAEIRRGLTEDEVMDLLIGSNIDRQSFVELLYSVQAKILIERQKTLLNIKKNAGKTDTQNIETSGEMDDKSADSQNENGKRINDQLEYEYSLDRNKVARLLRMGEYLNKELFEKTDKKIIPFMAAYDLSFLPSKEQMLVNTEINNIVRENKNFKLDCKMAEKLKVACGALSIEKVANILRGKVQKKTPNKKMSVTLGAKMLKPYFNAGASSKDIRTEIVKALKYRIDINNLVKKHLSSSTPTAPDIETFIKFFKKDFSYQK